MKLFVLIAVVILYSATGGNASAMAYTVKQQFIDMAITQCYQDWSKGKDPKRLNWGELVLGDEYTECLLEHGIVMNRGLLSDLPTSTPNVPLNQHYVDRMVLEGFYQLTDEGSTMMTDMIRAGKLSSDPLVAFSPFDLPNRKAVAGPAGSVAVTPNTNNTKSDIKQDKPRSKLLYVVPSDQEDSDPDTRPVFIH